MKRINLYIMAVLLLGTAFCAALYGCGASQNSITPRQSTASTPYPARAISPGAVIPRLLPDDLTTIQEPLEAVPLDTIPGSITVLVNRKYLLPSTYAPADLIEAKIRFSFNYSNDKRKLRKEAAKSLEKMFKAAEKKKIILYGVSGYRSYARQKQIYDQNVARRGKSATDTVSARPGGSETQADSISPHGAWAVSCPRRSVIPRRGNGSPKTPINTAISSGTLTANQRSPDITMNPGIYGMSASPSPPICTKTN